MGEPPPGGISVVQKITPLGGQRGSDVVVVEGRALILEAGTWVVVWNTLKEEAVGPKGKYGVVCVSEATIEVPSGLWPVVTSRGGGMVAILSRDCVYQWAL